MGNIHKQHPHTHTHTHHLSSGCNLYCISAYLQYCFPTSDGICHPISSGTSSWSQLQCRSDPYHHVVGVGTTTLYHSTPAVRPDSKAVTMSPSADTTIYISQDETWAAGNPMPHEYFRDPIKLQMPVSDPAKTPVPNHDESDPSTCALWRTDADSPGKKMYPSLQVTLTARCSWRTGFVPCSISWIQ